MTLKSLAEHNEEVFRRHASIREEENGNGLECPNCEAELYDSEPGIVLTSNPPQHRVACRECDFKGTRY